MKAEKEWIRRIERSVLILGVVIIPLFYSYFYLDAFWDPYNKLNAIPVAVVNNDTGATINGKFRNLGDQMVNTLKNEKSLKWVFTNENDAKAGLETGKKYYSVITIPNDFSKKFATVDSTNKEQATITYSSNQKRNYIANQILRNAMTQLEEKMRARVTEEVTGQLTDKLNQVPTQLGKLDDGLIQLNDGSTALANGMNKLNTGSQMLSTNLATLTNGLGQASTGSKKLNNGLTGIPALRAGVSKLNSGASQLSNGLNQVAAGVTTLNNGAADISKLNDGITSLNAGATRLLNGTTDLSTGTEQLFQGASKLYAGTSQLSDGTQQYVQTVNTIAMILKGYGDINHTEVETLGANLDALSRIPNPTDAQKQQLEAGKTLYGLFTGAADSKLMAAGSTLVAGASSVNDGAKGINDGVKGLNSGAAAVNAGAKQISGGTSQLKASEAKLAALQKGISDLKTAVDQLSAGSKQVSGGTAALAANTAQLKQLQSGVSELSTALAALQDGSSQLYDGSKTLQEGISSAKDGANKLQDGTNTAKKGVEDSIQTANQKLKATDGLAKYSGESVSVKSNPVNAVPNNGTAFAPYFLSLSMWVGALMMLFGIYLDPGKRIKCLAKGTDTLSVRIAVFFCIGIAQSLFLAIVLQNGLGLHVNNVVPYYFSIILGSMMFISIVQFCIVYLGDAGKFLTILFLILQLTSCGGTYPMETLPQIFNVLYKFMPMTYMVELLKEVISGNDMEYAWHNAIILICILIVFVALTIIFALIKKEKQKRLANATIMEVDQFHV